MIEQLSSPTTVDKNSVEEALKNYKKLENSQKTEFWSKISEEIKKMKNKLYRLSLHYIKYHKKS